MKQKSKTTSKDGTKAEMKVWKWLKGQDFVVGPCPRKAHTGCYDIKATAPNGKVWLVEVKSGKNPRINLSNFLKMMHCKKSAYKVLAIVPQKGLNEMQTDEPYFLKMSWQSAAAQKAAKTKKAKKEAANLRNTSAGMTARL